MNANNVQGDLHIVSFLFLNFLEDVCPFCGATDIPVLDFWWHLSTLGLKARVNPSFAYFLACMQWFHLWCNTCQAFSIHVLADIFTSIGGAQTHDQPCCGIMVVTVQLLWLGVIYRQFHFCSKFSRCRSRGALGAHVPPPGRILRPPN